MKDVNFLEKIIHPEDLSSLTDFMKTQSSILKFRICLPNNQIKWIKYILRVIKLDSTEYFFNIFQDITTKMMNSELSKFIAKSIDKAPYGVLIIHPLTLEYLYVNEAAFIITGYSTDEFYKKGHHFWREQLVDKNSSEIFEYTIQNFELLQFGNFSFSSKYDILRSDKTICTILATITVNRYNDIDYRVITFVDITKSNIDYSLNK